MFYNVNQFMLAKQKINQKRILMVLRRTTCPTMGSPTLSGLVMQTATRTYMTNA